MSALLLCPTVKSAVASAGIPEPTAYRYLRDPVFSKEYKHRKRQAVQEASDYLQSRISAATAIIDEIMSDSKTPAHVRLNAAKAIIETGYKMIEQGEILERIADIEAVLNDNER
jgi:transcription initiation factor TFIIIB Brf1 subunit/transcription initiation factor TFIIB